MIIEIRFPQNGFKVDKAIELKICENIENEIKEDPFSDEYTYYFLLNYYVKKILIEKKGFDFQLELCGLHKTSYKFFFDQFLNIFPDILKSLNTKSNFTLDMIEQGYDNYYNFNLNGDFYVINAVNIYNIQIGENEVISVDEVVDVFDRIKEFFLSMVKSYFTEDFYMLYKKYLGII